MMQPVEGARELSLGYSPCPNDTFIFYALANKKIGNPGLRFRETLLDVETLNQMAFGGEFDITKVSFHALGHLRDKYRLLSSGGALGRGCGPLVITRPGRSIEDLRGKPIAIPGRLTTAFLLLMLYDSSLSENAIPMPFDRIPHAVEKGEVDGGLIIHESRFTYQDYGLVKLRDLGAWWEEETGLPIPLGCIIAKRHLGEGMIKTVEGLIRESIEYAYSHTEETREYVKAHAQEMDDMVIEQHIRLYVNDYSLDLGIEGMRAVEELLKRAETARFRGRNQSPSICPRE
jgi:1,4-dihydroxy-6-naphthoate synthase